jgi:hypothetical protein
VASPVHVGFGGRSDLDGNIVTLSDRALEDAILRLVDERGLHGSICPSDAARRAVAGTGLEWHTVLLPVRRAAVRLALAGHVVILRKGKPADPQTFRGVYRIASAEAFVKANGEPVEFVPDTVPAEDSPGAWPEPAPYPPPPPPDAEFPTGPIRPGTMPDIAAALEHYLTAKLDDAPGGDAEVVDDVVGLFGEQDVEPVLPERHAPLRRDFE